MSKPLFLLVASFGVSLSITSIFFAILAMVTVKLDLPKFFYSADFYIYLTYFMTATSFGYLLFNGACKEKK